MQVYDPTCVVAIGDPNKAMGLGPDTSGTRYDTTPLPHDIQRVEDAMRRTTHFRCTRCKETLTHEQGTSRWGQTRYHFTPVCPVWP